MTGDPSRPPIVVAHDRPEDFASDLETRAPGERFIYATDGPSVLRLLAEHNPEVVLSISHSGFQGPLHHPIVEHPSVRWVQVGGSGYEHLEPWDASRLVVTNGVGVLARFLAETTIGAMLALNARLPEYARDQAETRWRPRTFRTLSEQTILIVGLGHIGTWMARYARALGMRVLATRRSATPSPAVDELHPPEALLELLPRADVVSLHVRLNEATRHLIDTRALEAMKPGALLLNTARGPVVDEPALIEALASGHLGGAYLDVFEEEPLPVSSALWRLPNVIVTPHASDAVEDWAHRFAMLFADNLERWRAGEPLLNVVTPSS
ncbi:MAG: D-2-hydroxyacid dehydrogenase [Dehalococcoidia bacterium]